MKKLSYIIGCLFLMLFVWVSCDNEDNRMQTTGYLELGVSKNVEVVTRGFDVKDQSLAVDICTGSGAGVLLLVRNDQFDDIYAKVVSYGVLTLSKPTNMQMVAQNLRILCATRERMRQMEAKQATVEEKIEEIRLVNRAKWLLIECLGMTEPEAHRYIEKQSMDQRISKREAAEAVIKTYK